ncbi:MAG: DUF4838 domain-containing protein, partial [Bacteroidota bacterium]
MKYFVINRRKFTLVWHLIVGVLIITNFYSCSDKNIVIVHNGVSEYEIVTSENTSKDEQHAAAEFQHYLKKISEVNIPIVDEKEQNEKKKKIFIKKLDVNEHEIVIRAEGDNIFIGGGSNIATKNAVYQFLETYLNCKWYAPEVEDIPELKSIILERSMAFSYIPDITTRTVSSRLFYKNPDFAEKLKVTKLAFPHYVPSARVHTFHKFIPEEKFYKNHPEYFALRGGKRIPTQLCLTNKEVLEIVKDSVRSLFKQYPNSKVISVSQDDNQQYCVCDECSKIDEEEGSPSGTMIRFVNKIATAFPDKTISTLAYQYTRTPSKTKPARNVLITLCSIECDRSAPIEEKCT